MASVDPREIEKYTKRAAVWWDLNGPQMLLHKHTTAIRIPFIVHGLASTGLALRGLKVLDVGCGGGITSEPLALMGADVTGVDPAPALIEVAQNHQKVHAGLDIAYVCDSIEAFSDGNAAQFDAVVCCEVLEHVTDVRSVLRASVATMKPGAHLFVTTFNRTVFSFVWAIVVMELLCGIIPRGAHKWRMFVPPEDVADILDELGCRTVEVRGAWYSIFKRKWRESRYTGVFYGLHAVKER